MARVVRSISTRDTRSTTTAGGARDYLRDGRAPLPEDEVTSRVMRSNRARDTGPELTLRRELLRRGIRGYRLHRKLVPGRPDLSFGPQKVAVFVNGCYWHRCPRCDLPLPKTHVSFWATKFEANRRRDAAKTAMLKAAGWRVLTLWECEVSENPSGAADRVEELLGGPS
jgi:DNA mismatch endonuclease, patch repair protein